MNTMPSRTRGASAVFLGCTALLFVSAFLAPSAALAQGDPRPGAPTTPPGSETPPDQPLVGPPIQRIQTASALSTEPLGNIAGVFELRDGRVLVNDGLRRRLLLMDTTLALVTPVLDSLSEVANTYGPRPGALLPYRGDSILFVDPASFAMVVLDPQGIVSRIRSVWRVEHVPYFTAQSSLYGTPGLDAKGRMVHRIPAQAARPLVPPPSNVPYLPPQPDSAFVVAVDLDTRRLDTLGVIRIPKVERNIRMMEGGLGFMLESVTNPLPSTDDWAVLPDGTIAFVRGREYRIDYLNPDGTRSTSERLPYEWQRLNDEDKARLVDSTRTVMLRSATNSYVTAMIRWVNFYGQQYPEGFAAPPGYVPTMGFAREWTLPPGVEFPERYVYQCRPGEEPVTPPAPAGPPAPGTPPAMPSCVPPLATISTTRPTLRQPTIVEPSELPDYRPPFVQSSVRADLDGNLWIRTVPVRPVPGGGPVYDIVSRAGQLVNRIQLPTGYTLVGFGRDKVVYLSMRDASGIHLARVRLR
jgi:hypothetical protein